MVEPRDVCSPGIVVIDKPRGPTSHQVAAWVREIVDLPVGHAGTLDPGVSGVLVVMLGPAVRLAPLFLSTEKEYICMMRLHADVDPAKVREIVGKFTGRIYQRPPKKSAVARTLRIRTISIIDVLEICNRDVLIRVQCDAGTYIRSLCHHVGLALGCGAHMQELRRTRSGGFSEKDAHSLQELRDAAQAAQEGISAPLRSMIVPVQEAVHGVPRVTIRDTAVDAVCHGAVLAGVGILTMESFRKGDTVLVVTGSGDVVCLGEALISSASVIPGQNGLVIAPRVVLMRTGTYRRAWKKRSKIQSPTQ
ncbi:MAG: RNA-guided pseudouridylation complex pseudouridine synthase subunit Cbf5 [Methanomicrobiales archaeon]|nr:RNA-guided pseudouridylation complex pseudouridine synthase subunit Cbf5 [Methanomicrobiales archaeon]